MSKLGAATVWGLLALGPFSARPCAAQTAGKVDEKRAYLEELEKEKRERPARYAEAKLLFTFNTEALLGRLGYGIGPFDGVLDAKEVEALRAYERARGIPVTGDPVSFETLESITSDQATLDTNLPYLPSLSVYTDMWDRGYVTAQGTWTIKGEKMGMPLQTSRIECDRHAGVCTEATAILTIDKAQPNLSVEIDTYAIERWDEFEIVTKPLQFGCTRYMRRISKPQKTVSGIRSTTGSTAECRGIDQGEKYLALADGFGVYWALQQGHAEKSRGLVLIAPEMRKKLEQPKSQDK